MQQNLGLDSKGMARSVGGNPVGSTTARPSVAVGRSVRQAASPGLGGRHLQSFFSPPLVGAQESGSLSSLVVGVFGVNGGVQQWGFGICPFAQASGQVL